MKSIGTVAICLSLSIPGALAGPGDPPELRRLFPHQALIYSEGDGLTRLVLPPELLSSCRPDLSDLRLFDRHQREIAFLVDSGAQNGAIEISQRAVPTLLETSRGQTRRETGPPIRRETFDLALPDVRPRTGAWTLILETGHPEFVARVTVLGVSGSGPATELVSGGSLFRLRGVRSAEKLRLALPAFDGERLRVVLETEHGFWLVPSFRLASANVLEHGGSATVPLEAVSMHHEAGKTVVLLARPRGLILNLLRLETETPNFDRRVRVWDEGSGSTSQALGEADLFRVEAVAPVGRNEIALRTASGDRLRVEIDDGDSPPLREPSFVAIVRQPSLVFSIDEVALDGVAGTLRFGGGRAHRPRYDLAGLLPATGRVVTGERAEAAAALHDPAVVGSARLAATQANPDYDGQPALAFAMHPGAEIDRRLFRHARSLRVPRAPEGLSRLLLGPEDLAALKEDLGDLRVADASSRQWPYLVERAAHARLVRLDVAGYQRRDANSHYELRFPVSPLPIERLILEIDAAYFDRGFRLIVEHGDGQESVLEGRRLQRAMGQSRPVNIDVSARATALELIVDDGDDAALELLKAEVTVLLPELYLTAPEGDYTLLLGAPDEPAPLYELDRVRDVVLAVRSVPVEAAALAENRDFSLGARLRSGEASAQRVLLWIVLVGAVVVLAVLTLRLARRESG